MCGAVRFQIDPPLRDILVCHCSLCRRSGTLAGAYTEVADKAFRLTREDGLAWYVDVNDRKRGFCRVCGSTLLWRSQGDSISVSAGALDAPSGLGVEAHIFVADIAGWESVSTDAPHHPGSSSAV
jgi:hypothetical protein